MIECNADIRTEAIGWEQQLKLLERQRSGGLRSRLAQAKSETLSPNNQSKRTGGMSQVVQHLPTSTRL
jgi:hypothetical protein